MKPMTIAAAAALLGSVAIATPATAHPHHPRHHYHHSVRHIRREGRTARFSHRHGTRHYHVRNNAQAPTPPRAVGLFNDPRPRQWCAWWLRHLLGIPLGIVNNTALSFLHWGHPTTPHQGAVVIWNHGRGHGHVGKITGPQCGPNRWVVTSANTGRDHGIHTVCRSVAGASFREQS